MARTPNEGSETNGSGRVRCALPTTSVEMQRAGSESNSRRAKHRSQHALAAPAAKRARRPAWAFFPRGSQLESRLRRLLHSSAEDWLHDMLSPSLREQVVDSVDNDSGDQAAPSATQVDSSTAPAHNAASSSHSDHSESEAQSQSQELPLLMSQMSEGLEILLRASQDCSVDLLPRAPQLGKSRIVFTTLDSANDDINE